MWGGENKSIVERYDARMDKWTFENDSLNETFQGGVILKM